MIDVKKLEETAFMIRNMVEKMAQGYVDKGAEVEEIVDLALAFPVYEQAKLHKKDEVVTDEEFRQPYRCLIEYDGVVQPDWNLSTPSLWFPYHNKDIVNPYPFRVPTCAQDIYKAGETALFKEQICRALVDTSYSPEDQPEAWEIIPAPEE